MEARKCSSYDVSSLVCSGDLMLCGIRVEAQLKALCGGTCYVQSSSLGSQAPLLRMAGLGGSSLEGHSVDSRNILEPVRNFLLFHLLSPDEK